MFYIYTPQGRVFSGPLETLRKVEASTSSAKGEVRQEFMLDSEIEASYSYSGQSHKETQEIHAGGETPYTASQRSISQYNQTLKSRGQREPVYHVFQIMSRPVISVAPDFTLATVFHAFENHPFKLLPIVSDNHLLAAIAREQLYHLLLSNDRATFEKTLVSEWMASGEQRVLTADPVTDVRRAARVLLEERLDALPVVDNAGQIQGIVSRSDILECVVKDPPLSIWA